MVVVVVMMMMVMVRAGARVVVIVRRPSLVPLRTRANRHVHVRAVRIIKRIEHNRTALVERRTVERIAVRSVRVHLRRIRGGVLRTEAATKVGKHKPVNQH
jgi:hypothetical protein